MFVHRFDAIAALQKYAEYLLTGWVNNIMSSKVTKNLCIAGGVAMNVKANLEISKLRKISQVYIPPRLTIAQPWSILCVLFDE